ncbi:NAD(P)H-hydrate dehydratase [Herbiconiux sp. CPCC 203407]|uniref:ADP-dependent (S)-NAD(P)H-hydrate dehydratase n=1 Tax=Herbiconiux oxytropis TaxID=2970915 RepID=A0AA41XJU4_9MICO|nr:NAD(P)H-hydrate dehydratase [Herbiconiux oxytropis]MCS5723562.1 NAD(P)H-hydrate dehydratase [Herbiconiux oxytropis]MCS5727488.1 NAD(P)H-hydrate dehydratase [Herbiconiux oxytropis]
MSPQNPPADDATEASARPHAEAVTLLLLREWSLPGPGSSKYDRGQVVVVGGDRRSPGAALLAAEAALRVGAGRLTVAIAEGVAVAASVALPESGVVALAETEQGGLLHIDGTSIEAAADDLGNADAVLVGPGLDDADQARRLLDLLPGLVGEETVVVLDAYALGVLPQSAVGDAFAGRLVLTPNTGEAGLLRDGLNDDEAHDEGDGGDDPAALALEVARGYGAVVSCQGFIAHPDGRSWQIGTGHGGLGTSGSGDVLAGAIAGLCARGASPEQAAVWATHAHAAAGDRLAVDVGPLGFLARELLQELPRVLVEIG